MFFFNSKKIKYNFIIIIIIALGFLLRVYGFNTNGYWADEWYTIFFSNPEKTFAEFKFNLKQAPGLPHYENTPWLFYIILKIIFLIFGYSAEIGRIFILIFAVGSIYLCLKLIRFYTKDRQLIIFFLILICLNPFLVLNSQETRVQSVVLFFGLWNLIQFLKLISQINLKNTITFAASMVLVMSFSPITSTLLASYLIYILMIFNKKKIIHFFIIFLFTFFIYIFFNYEYLTNVFLNKQFQGINLKFFISFFFSTFFGNYFFGGIALIFLFIASIINYKRIFIDKKIFLIYTIIITTYFLLILKSFSSNLLVPRYIIFIVPLILIIIIKNIENTFFFKKKLLKSFFINLFIFFSIIIIFNSLNDAPIKKPPTNDLIAKISKSKVVAVSSENFLFGNYFRTHYLFKKNNLKYIKYDELNDNIESIWLICANNMRSVVPHENLQDYRYVKCSAQKLESKMNVVETINIPDLQARLYVKK